MENKKYKNASVSQKKKKNSFADKNSSKQTRSRVLSLAQLLSRVRKQRGFAGLLQGNSQSSSIQNNQSLPSVALRELRSAGGTQRSNQMGAGSGSKTSYNTFSNSMYENKGKGRFFVDQNVNNQRDKSFTSYSSGTKSQIRMESQKDEQKRQRPIKPIIPPKSLIILLRENPEKVLYNRRIIDYKHCGLLQRYIGLGGKILPRRQTRLTAKQQRYIAKTIKSARIMGLLPFVSKEKTYFR